MQRKIRVVMVLSVVLVSLGAVGCDKLKARDLLNKGVNAYKSAEFDVAIEDFKQAKDLDPTLTNAQLYLATAYATQYIPGAPRPRMFATANRPLRNSRKSWRKTQTIFPPSTVSARFSITWPARPSTRARWTNRRRIIKSISP